MKRLISLAMILLLSACGSTETTAVESRPAVSRADMPITEGLTYEQFRDHPFNKNTEMGAIQKRFILLDRDHNGVLSSNEFSD